jgi:hypothetical protein
MDDPLNSILHGLIGIDFQYQMHAPLEVKSKVYFFMGPHSRPNRRQDIYDCRQNNDENS